MINLDNLRKDYRTVRTWAVDCGEWTAEQADEIAQAIKTAIAEQDTGYLAWWADWMATWAVIAETLSNALVSLYERELKRLRDERAGRMLKVAA